MWHAARLSLMVSLLLAAQRVFAGSSPQDTPSHVQALPATSQRAAPQAETTTSVTPSDALAAVRKDIAAGQLGEALQSLGAIVGGWRWTVHEDYADIEAVGRELGLAMLDADDALGALRAFSLVARASRNPVDYLYELMAQLDKTARGKLWPDTPYLIVEDFEDDLAQPLQGIVEAQGREVLVSDINIQGSPRPNRCARLKVTPSKRSGRSWYALSTPGFAVSGKPFGLRLSIREQQPTLAYLVVRYWLVGPESSIEIIHETSAPNDSGWEIFDTGVDFYRVKQHLAHVSQKDVSGATILDIGIDFPQGPANTFWIDEVQVYVPANWEQLARAATGTDAPTKPLPPGHWAPFRRAPSDKQLTQEQEEAFAELEALGYLGGTETPASQANRGVFHNKDLAYQGYTFYVSGHGAEAILIDMDGNVVHTWHGDYSSLWPEDEAPMGAERQGLWRRAYPFENGDILAIHEGRALVKLDKDSKVLWANRGGYHHDLHVMGDGTIYVLTREARILPRINEKEPVLEDSVAILRPDGEEIRTVSLLECFENSYYAPTFFGHLPDEGDIFHTNTIEVLDGRLDHKSPAFKKGNVLVSVKVLETVAVVDLDQEKVVWALLGMWLRQHQPTVLDNGHMLIFDNLGPFMARKGGERYSRVLEFDPFSQEMVWEYRGTRAEPFFSKTCGSCQRLPNGNTLITESTRGRAFEVTPNGDIVWELNNPQRAGENDGFIASIFEAIRLGPDFPIGWADRAP